MSVNFVGVESTAFLPISNQYITHKTMEVNRQLSYPEIATPRLNFNRPIAKKTSTVRKNDAGDIPEIDWADIEVKESLGNGEFGQVFRGTWKNHEVAIKALYRDPNKTADQAAIQELRKEIESFRHLDHKRLVKFVGACFQHPHLCFVTEYMSNGSLYNFLHVRKVRLPSRHSLNMVMQLCEGVDYLHSRNPIVVHRDLKSLNVVLDLSFNIKLCDFGLTEYLDPANSRARHNGGSPRYMAPELFDKKLKITEKIDVWAMACIFCEIWGGTIPYDGVKDMPTLTHIMTTQKKSPNIPNIELESVKNLIRDCFSFDQDQRPSSRDVAKSLNKIKQANRDL